MIVERVENVMKTDVDTVAPDCPIEAVVGKLSERRVSCVVVCDGDSPVGIVSPKDLIGAALEEHAEDLVVAADAMLYRAKESGRNRVEFARV